ncbi:MAG: ugpC 3 [Devosia sp.]|uniref:ABC transporter ATP-binding protein n=1 Tax=Devosia sp. TaxID=1871048 RepID=UPI002602796B|nr:sn-glycerol-3-phosphate ABC transporter ATP-binding protein UgpC [Devosia sp.]MDB5529463.1 ugpC 3 [Devosia sp.]
MAFLVLKNIRKSFGPTTVIPDLNLEIETGEFVALVGPSGCGKSTLLRAIAGLEEIDTGEIWIEGRQIDELGPKDRNIAMVFQSYALYPHKTVRDNMGFSLKLAKRPKEEIDARVGEVARMLHLDALLDRKPGQLSGGQRQRVAMGRAIVRRPKVFLFDEPLSNLDAKLRVAMRAEIKLLHQSVQTTSVYVTHDQIEAMTLADRLVVLNKGVIEQQGTPLELYSNPCNMFVAGFIGSPAMNFLQGEIVEEGGQKVARLGGGARLPLPAGSSHAATARQVTLGLRPEHLTMQAGGPLTGSITMTEPTGAQTLVYFDVGGTLVTALVEGDTPLRVGDQFACGVNPGRIHAFDSATGNRI